MISKEIFSKYYGYQKAVEDENVKHTKERKSNAEETRIFLPWEI